jgi:four helix bundle protein
VPTIERFEELIAWQKARAFAREVHVAASTGPFSKDYGLRDQLDRCAASVMANIAEGFERGSRGEFHQFLSIAKGSCGEARSHLYVALDRHHINDAQFEHLMELVSEVSRLVSGLRTAVQAQRDRQRASTRSPT